MDLTDGVRLLSWPNVFPAHHQRYICLYSVKCAAIYKAVERVYSSCRRCRCGQSTRALRGNGRGTRRTGHEPVGIGGRILCLALHMEELHNKSVARGEDV